MTAERRARGPESWCVMGGKTLYATRPTLAEAQQVLAEQRHLIEKFGSPRVEQRVIPFPERA